MVQKIHPIIEDDVFDFISLYMKAFDVSSQGEAITSIVRRFAKKMPRDEKEYLIQIQKQKPRRRPDDDTEPLELTA